MSSSAITTQVAQLKAGNIQNQADSSSIYSAGVWSFKNSTAVASVTISDAGNVSVPGTTQISWPVDGGTSRGLVTIGAQGTTGGSLLVNTPSLSVGYASGLAVDGSYSSFISTVNIKALGVSSAGGYGSVLAFHTSSGTSSTEHMRIDSSGRLLVRTTVAPTGAWNSASTTNFGYGIQLTSPSNANYWRQISWSGSGVDSALYFPGGQALNVVANVAQLTPAGAWSNASDGRQKTNVKDLENGIEKVLQTKPRRYNRIDVEGEFVGFIAQELKEVVPEVVSGSDETSYAVSYGELVAVAFKAIQEQQAQIEEMKAKLAALEAKP